MATARETNAADKRRLILDAAVRVFAQRGFTGCRVSDIADEAGVAYGLVYHYFRSKDEVLDTLFLERWNVMLDVIRDLDGGDLPPREKLYAITSFIVDSYRHDPELMKVIIVEVTRAANSFGQTHLAKIREAYALIAAIVERAQGDGVLRRDRAGADGVDLRRAAGRRRRVRAGQGVRRGDDLRRARACSGHRVT
jgi:TetR/AcrR family transcriptional regulator, fatty acid metabolism regulator protein